MVLPESAFMVSLSLSLFVPRLYIYIYMIFIFIFLYFVEFCAVGFIFPIMLRPSSLPMFFQGIYMVTH
jgi:hypothetical protein